MNTYEKVIEYLKSYQEQKYNIVFYRNKMSGLKAITYSQEEKGTAINNMMSIYMGKIDKAEQKMREIENFIETNFEGEERLAIWHRYINCMQYKEISNSLGYAHGYSHQLIRKAVDKYVKYIQ